MSAAAAALNLVLPLIEGAVKNRLALHGPYHDEGGIPGEVYGLIDLDSIGEDPELRQMSGRAAQRLAYVAQGPLVLTTFLKEMDSHEATQSIARARFVELHSQAVEQIPLITQDLAQLATPCLVRRVRVNGDRLERVLFQHRKGGSGSNWTMHLVGEIQVHYIVHRDAVSGQHQFQQV